MSQIFTANRVAAIATWLTGLSALIAGVVGTMPHAWQNTALAVAGVALKGVTALQFMSGSQKYDSLTTPYPASVLDKLPASGLNNVPAPSIAEAVASLPDPVAPAAPVVAEVAPIPPAVA